MPKYRLYNIVASIAMALACGMILPLWAWGNDDMMVFKRISDRDAISDNNVQWIEQLPDGRMAVQTKSSLNIYDANGVTFYPREEEFMTMLPHHHRHFVTNADNKNRIWIKEWDKIWCIDLIKGSHIKNPMSLLHPNSLDVYFDDERNTVTLTPDSLISDGYGFSLPIASSKVGEVALNYRDKIIFDMDGGAYMLADGEWVHYPNDDVPKNQDWWYYRIFDNGDGVYYRMLSEFEYSRIDAFNSLEGEWQPVIKAEMVFYGMSTPMNGIMLVGTRHGFIEIDFGGAPSNIGYEGDLPNTVKSDRKIRLLTDFNVASQRGIVRTPGTVGISNIYKDWQGGWWLSMGRLGVFYYHPSHNLFDIGSAHQLGISDNKQYVSHEREKENWQFQKNIVNDFLIDRQGRQWYATHRGIVMQSDNDSILLTTKQGLPSNYILNLCLDDNGLLWVGTNYGICSIEIENGETKVSNYGFDDGIPGWQEMERTAIKLEDGRIAINCVEGWIAFDPVKVRHPYYNLTPILRDVHVEGVERFETTPFYLKTLKLSHLQNNLTLTFSTLNYAFPMNTYYRWRLKGSDSNEWHDGNEFIDEHGALKLSFLNLPPDNYELEVMASDDGITYDGDIARLRINVLPPWWLTWWAYCIYLAIFVAIIYLVVTKYTEYKEKELKQQHREAMLLQQIQQLMQASTVPAPQEEQSAEEEAAPDDSDDADDATFVQNAITLVEQHIKEQYTVEQLAKDLCMERTGLYKRLTTLVKKSPQTFIRSIRLNHAASMLRKGASVTETSEATGFNSISYFSRAFTKEFGMTPTEYASQQEPK